MSRPGLGTIAPGKLCSLSLLGDLGLKSTRPPSRVQNWNNPNLLSVYSFSPGSHSCFLQLPSSEFCVYPFSYLLTTLYLVNHSLYSILFDQVTGVVSVSWLTHAWNSHFNQFVDTELSKVNDSFCRVATGRSGCTLRWLRVTRWWQLLKNSTVKFSHMSKSHESIPSHRIFGWSVSLSVFQIASSVRGVIILSIYSRLYPCIYLYFLNEWTNEWKIKQ